MALTLDLDERIATPPTVSPSDRPLSTLPFVMTMISNPLAAWPNAVTETSIVVQMVGGKKIAFVSDPELLKEIFAPGTELFSKNPLEDRLYSSLMGDGLLTSNGHQWRWQRRTTAPMFRHNELIAQVPQMTEAANRILEKWRAGGSASIQPIDPVMRRATFEVVSTALLPEDANFEKSDIERWATDYLAGSTWDMAYAMLRIPHWVPHPRRRKAQKGARNIRRVIGRLIEQRRGDCRTGHDLLGRLLAAKDVVTGKPMPDKHVLDNVIGFLLAGHETTYSALTWAVFLLARYPNWQEKAREEIVRVAGDDGIDASHLDKLAVCQQIIKEAMRLYPPAPILSRVCTQDIHFGGHDFAPGTMFFVPVYAIHRHKGLWRDPDAFDPTRFAPEAEEGRQRFAYMPWGAGPRICIGAAFSLIEATVILATLLQQVWFSSAGQPDPVPLARITLRPQSTLFLRVAFGHRTRTRVNARLEACIEQV